MKIKYILSGIALVSALLGDAFAQTKPKYNVLFVAVDDMNDWVGPFGGYEGIKTPNIDKLAKKGVVFKKAYCAAPACNPSRASLLTGVRPSTSGVYHNNQPWRPVLKDAVTLPQYFTANGYDVKGAGKIFHNAFNDDASWPVYFDVPKSPEPPKAPVNGFAHFDWSPVDANDEDMGDFKVVNQGIEYFSQKHDNPFFLAIGLTRPHLPWYVPQKYYDLYPLSSIKLPKVVANDLSDVPDAGVKIAKPKGDHQFIVNNKQWEKAVQGYLASITFADTQIGRLLDALENSEYAKNTIIVFFGDHGWHLGEKEHWRKFALWEEASRVPLIVYAPGLSKVNSVSERTVNLLDIYPTLAELCNLPARKELEGNSIVPLLKNPSATWEHPSVTTHGFGNHAVRSEKWRYIRYNDGSEELYDHENDPQEFKNLAKVQKYSAEKIKLAKSLPAINKKDAPTVKEGKE
ncbi:sulfatase [Dyadobacter chenwenxiniae]|uniref:Sulfatase n=1 Tax=Dyadobacter chenwenxiniae TaxID=2906456 RepID=A0A9X1PJ74_9BACT|nr:sulfatase [Dyadobacter chenwenxiniae]MCF0062312.1 sulfatase [Dyadobacter chenwenxiniae]UON83932.1 sulfatase [Dyadobacter chenwenxiniae]